MKLVTKTHGVVFPFVSVGYGSNGLVAFDNAELNAGIIALNAVPYTSFVPVGPRGRWEIHRSEKIPFSIENGENLAMAHRFAYSGSQVVSAALAIGLDEDPNKPGIIMEYARVGLDKQTVVDEAVSSVKEVFSFREHLGWKLKEILIFGSSAKPKDGLVVGVLCGALYLPEQIHKLQEINNKK